MTEKEDNNIDEESKESEEESSEPTNKVEEAKAILEKIEAANKETKELMEKAEKLKAEEVISGRADAGSAPDPKISKEEQEKKDANTLMEGTGMVPWPEDKKKE